MRRRWQLKSWNFWTRITGTVYGIRAHHPRTGQLTFAYGGKTMQVPWTKRIEGHLFGTWDQPPKPWADTVPGWRPAHTARERKQVVREVVAAGGVFVVWQAATVPLVLTWMEILFGIRLRRPLYNSQWNTLNARRITPVEARKQRARRDAGRGRLPVRGGSSLRAVTGAVLLACGLTLLLVGVVITL